LFLFTSIQQDLPGVDDVIGLIATEVFLLRKESKVSECT